jgi:hypothetical protein
VKETKKLLSPAAVANLFERFALGGYKSIAFSEALYRYLSRAFGFIAHFNRAGFYTARFADLDVRVETLTAMSKTAEWFSERPVETSLREVVTKRGLLAAAVSDRDVLVEMVERAEFARLLDKYGLPDRKVR